MGTVLEHSEATRQPNTFILIIVNAAELSSQSQIKRQAVHGQPQSILASIVGNIKQSFEGTRCKSIRKILNRHIFEYWIGGWCRETHSNKTPFIASQRIDEEWTKRLS